MTNVNHKLKSTMTNIVGKNWADLCESSQSSESQLDYEFDSPVKKNNKSCTKDDDEDELYDLVFKSVKKEPVKVAPQDDRSLTSFMNDVHMVTPVKQENNKPVTNIINEDTICSPFVKVESKDIPDKNPKQTKVDSKEDFKDILHAKRRLTSESGPVLDPLTPERVNKVNKKSAEHRNIHDTVESPKYVYIFLINKKIIFYVTDKRESIIRL